MELYEAADVDGANGFVKFIKITMPYMLFVTAPYLITTFTANINNFNIVYLLTKGDPVMAGATAGKTDLLVTWLYKMTIDYQYYNLGAVIGIMTFIFLAIGSLLVYRRTKAYKDEEDSSEKKKTIKNILAHTVLTILAIVWVSPLFWILLKASGLRRVLIQAPSSQSSIHLIIM